VIHPFFDFVAKQHSTDHLPRILTAIIFEKHSNNQLVSFNDLLTYYLCESLVSLVG